jgi:hypothetical protein
LSLNTYNTFTKAKLEFRPGKTCDFSYILGPGAREDIIAVRGSLWYTMPEGAVMNIYTHTGSCTQCSLLQDMFLREFLRPGE